jgi:SRSO17 transposase
VVEETGDLNKGTATVGVQRQYTGTAGKVDNAQVAVYLAYATTAGHGVIDRELYLPRGWLADAERCQAAGVPDRVGFATKPQPAGVMLDRALEAGGSGGCWPAAAFAPGSWPTTWAPARPACRWLPWSRSPEPAGEWRRRPRPARALAGLDQH